MESVLGCGISDGDGDLGVLKRDRHRHRELKMWKEMGFAVVVLVVRIGRMQEEPEVLGC